MFNNSKRSVLPEVDRDDSLVLLTTETYDGYYAAELFHDKTQALAKMQRQKRTRSVDPTEKIKDGFMDKEGVIRRVQSLGESLSPDGKVIWRVSQKCFLPDSYGQFDWDNYFATRDEADALYNETVSLYRNQAHEIPAVTLKESKSKDEMLVFLNDKPAVYIDFLARPVGQITDVGTILLNAFAAPKSNSAVSKQPVTTNSPELSESFTLHLFN